MIQQKILFLTQSGILPMFSDFEKTMSWLLIRGHSVTFTHLRYKEKRDEHRKQLQDILFDQRWFTVIFVPKNIVDLDPNAVFGFDRIFVLEDGDTPEIILKNVEKFSGV